MQNLNNTEQPVSSSIRIISFKKELLMPPKYTVENGKKKRMLIIYLEQNTASNLDNNCSRVVCFVFVIYLLLTTVNIGRTP